MISKIFRVPDFILILSSVAVARLPLLWLLRLSGDEALYALVGHEWLQGFLPYTRLWDVKPPGLFALYALTEALTGDALLGPRLLPLLAVAVSALGLWAIGAIRLGDRRIGLIAAVLYPAYTLPLEGVMGTSELLLQPFVVLALLLAGGRSLASVCLSGLLFGVAVTIKQVAVFEGLLGLVLVIYAAATDRWSLAARIGGFGLAGLLPAVALGLTYAAQGHVDDLWNAAVLAALLRTRGDGLSVLNGIQRFLPSLRPLLPIVALAMIAYVERDRLRRPGAPEALLLVFGWLAAAAAAILALRAMYGHYFLTLAPPAALATGMLLLDLRRRWLGGSTVAVGLVVALLAAFPFGWVTLQREWPTGDTLVVAVGKRLAELGLVRGSDAELWVVEHMLALHLLTDTSPITKFAVPQHLQCDFPLPRTVVAEAEIDRILALAPRFVVIAAPGPRMVCTRAERMARIEAGLERSWERVDRLSDGLSTVEIWRRRGWSPNP